MADLQETIRQCQRGNALAWEALIKSHQGRVYAAAFYYFRTREESQDATQEIFLRAYRSLSRFRSEENSFVSWLMAIARNTCVDLLRRRDTRARLEHRAATDPAMAVDESHDPELQTSLDERKQMIYEALDGFSEITREILLLKDIHGLRLEEVAKILSLPLGTVKSRSNRARLELAKSLSGRLVDEPGTR